MCSYSDAACSGVGGSSSEPDQPTHSAAGAHPVQPAEGEGGCAERAAGQPEGEVGSGVRYAPDTTAI